MKRSTLLLMVTGFLGFSVQQSAQAQFQKELTPVAESSWKMEYVQSAFGGVQPDPPKPPDELLLGGPQFKIDDVVSSTPTIPLPPPKELVEDLLVLEDIADELDLGDDELLEILFVMLDQDPVSPNVYPADLELKLPAIWPCPSPIERLLEGIAQGDPSPQPSLIAQPPHLRDIPKIDELMPYLRDMEELKGLLSMDPKGKDYDWCLTPPGFGPWPPLPPRFE